MSCPASWLRFASHRVEGVKRVRNAASVATAGAVLSGLLVGCGGGGHKASDKPKATTTTSTTQPSTPAGAIAEYVRLWNAQNWKAMEPMLQKAPSDYVQQNQQALKTLGARSLKVTSGVITTRSNGTGGAPLTSVYQTKQFGTLTFHTFLNLDKVGDLWRVNWTPAAINSALGSGGYFTVQTTWPTRADILGADNKVLMSTVPQVQVGVVGDRIKDYPLVRQLLIAGGAQASEVDTALNSARQYPKQYVPVFQVSQSVFTNQIKRSQLYSVKGTTFLTTSAQVPATKELGEYVLGTTGQVTAQELKQLGSPYGIGDTVGQNGIEANYEHQLAGKPGLTLYAESTQGTLSNPIAKTNPTPGKPVVTTINLKDQQAAENAISSAGQPAALVAVQANTGKLLAAAVTDPANSGINYALNALEAPGSTFKTVVSTALIQDAGYNLNSTVTCPSSITVNGQRVQNDEGESDPNLITLVHAFAQSCNTAFIQMLLKSLKPSELLAAAKSYNLGIEPKMGLSVYQGSVPAPSDQNFWAAMAIGQGQITVSPLNMAMVAAAIDSGTVNQAKLVTTAPSYTAASHPVNPTVDSYLHTMMAAVVSSGTAAGVGLPAGTYAKTGTAQYGASDNPDSHCWLIGFRGNVAFAAWVYSGVAGGPVDGPMVAKFLNAIG